MQAVESTLTRVAQLQARFAPLARTSPALTPVSDRAPASTARSAVGAATFEQVLATATGQLAGAAPLTPARRMAAGQYGALTPPGELAAYDNGRIPPGRLAAIDGAGNQLWAPAATAFRQMSVAAARDGVTLGVSDSYRDLADQQHMAREKGLYSQGGLAAAPGTSTHGWGVSVDLELNGRGQQWMRDNGWRYGYVEDVPREPWHWTYRPA